ncbi:MAG: hypothetical protein R6W99_02450 [Clostridia bacterium]
MKKSLVLLLVLIFALIPSHAFSLESDSPETRYVINDSQLSSIKAACLELMETREEDVLRLENMPISHGNPFYHALSLAGRDVQIKEVDWKIESLQNAIKSREAWLEIDFRGKWLDLYEKRISLENFFEDSNRAALEYESASASHRLGYISKSALRQVEFFAVSSYHSYLAQNRSYSSLLRRFNISLGVPMDYDGYVFEFIEDPLEIPDLSVLIDSAIHNTDSLINIRHLIERYETEARYLDEYVISKNYGYVMEKVESLELNLALQKLLLSRSEDEMKEKALLSHQAVSLEREMITLEELAIGILKKQYDTNFMLYRRGYIDGTELASSHAAFLEAERDLAASVYSFNTKVMNLKYTCAYYHGESETE